MKQPKYPFFTPNDESDEYDGRNPPKPTPEQLERVKAMSDEELVDRLFDTARFGHLREFDLLLIAADVHEKASEGTFTNQIWMVYNVYGAPAGIDVETRAEALGELAEWRKR